jgi:hypothetical protein
VRNAVPDYKAHSVSSCQQGMGAEQGVILCR